MDARRALQMLRQHSPATLAAFGASVADETVHRIAAAGGGSTGGGYRMTPITLVVPAASAAAAAAAAFDAAPSPSLRKGICSSCGTSGASKKCVCRAALYCGKECQLAHWKARRGVSLLSLANSCDMA